MMANVRKTGRPCEQLAGASVGTMIMASPGSTGNVIAALASFFIPGLGQLLQGKLLKALIMFVAAAVLWWFWMGWIIHLWSIIDAALYKRPDVVR
jgi:TM2 domain-containing membrane protein YozV